MTEIIKDILGFFFGWLKKHDVSDEESATECDTVADIHAANETEIEQQGQLADPMPEVEAPVIIEPVVIRHAPFAEDTPLIFCECSTARDYDIHGVIVCAIEGKGKAGKHPCLCLHPWYLEGQTNLAKSKELWTEINTTWTTNKVDAWGELSVEEAAEEGYKYLCIDTEGVYCDARWREFLNPTIYKACKFYGIYCIQVPKADLSHMINDLGCADYQAAADYLEQHSDGVVLWWYGAGCDALHGYADKLRGAGYSGQIWLMVRAKEKAGDASEAEKIKTLELTLEKDGVLPAVFQPKEDREGPEMEVLRRAMV